MSKQDPSTQPWYHEGLKFECTGCGDCCTGSPGYVWVNQEEVVAMAAQVNLTVTEFEDEYTRKIGIRRSLKELPGSYDCVFLDSETRKCQVYSARPRQCKTWPFWDSNLRSPDDWERTCDQCPGSGSGKLYQLDYIDQQRAVIKI